jgi:hypothetical protein
MRVQYLNDGTIIDQDDFRNACDLNSLIQRILEMYWEDDDGQCVIWEGKAVVATIVTTHRATDESGFRSGIVSVTTYDGLTPVATLYRVAYLGSEDGESYESTEILTIEPSEVEAWM